MSVTPLPDPPLSGDPINTWPARADAFVAALPPAIAELNGAFADLSITALAAAGVVPLTSADLDDAAGFAGDAADSKDAAEAAKDQTASAGPPVMAGHSGHVWVVGPDETAGSFRVQGDTFTVGSVIIAVTQPSPSWLECDGSTVLEADFPDLAGILDSDGLGGLILPEFAEIPDHMLFRKTPGTHWIKAEAD